VSGTGSGGGNSGLAGVASCGEAPPSYRRSRRAGAVPAARRPHAGEATTSGKSCWRRRAVGTSRRLCELTNVIHPVRWMVSAADKPAGAVLL
jgi:hypothetical protein